MAKLSEEQLAAWEKTHDLNAELSQALGEMKQGEWARKTEITTQADGLPAGYGAVLERVILISFW